MKKKGAFAPKEEDSQENSGTNEISEFWTNQISCDKFRLFLQQSSCRKTSG
jgi:hypothetical protein